MIIHSCVLLLAAQAALAAVRPRHQQPPRSETASTLFSLPGSTTSWLENLAYRPSTDTVLATRLLVAQLWSISARTGTGTLLANVTDVTGLVGITQTRSSPDEFYVAGVSFSDAGVEANSSALYRLAFSPAREGESQRYEDGVGKFTFEKAFGVPGIRLINGLTTWDERTVLATDSLGGAIWKIDVVTGEAIIVLEDPSMAPKASNGVNGIKVFHAPDNQGTYIYYSNTDQSLLARILVDPTTACPLAGADILAGDLGEADDFALLDDGGVLLATGGNNTVVHVGLDGSVEAVAGSQNSLELVSATSCQFGMKREDGQGTLYVTTAGGEEGLVNGTLFAAGSVVAVEIGEGY